MTPPPIEARHMSLVTSLRTIAAARWTCRLAELVLGPIARAAHFPLDADASLVAIPAAPVIKRGERSPIVN